MSLFDSVDDLLPGLLPAAFRGVPFHAVDANHEVGRRIVGSYFPGLDPKAHEDLGRLDGPIELAGLVIGDDYVRQAQALQRALQSRGPGTLLHPWLGEITVVPHEPARISFAIKELRVARVELYFERAALSAGVAASTLSRLLGSVGSLVGAAGEMATAALTMRGLPAILWQTGREAADLALAAAEGALARSRGAGLLSPAMEPAGARIAAVDVLPVGPQAAAALAAAVMALPEALVALSSPLPNPAIGPGGAVLAERDTALERVDGAALALAIAAEIARMERASSQAGAVLLAAEVGLIAAAVTIAAEIAFVSRQDAMGWRDRLDDALTAAGGRAAILAEGAAAAAAVRVWRAVETTRSDLAIDLHEIIGRLPSVRAVTPPSTISAFQLAQHLVGDDPRRVVAMVDDITRRNRLRHPALVPPEPIEVLT